MAPACRTLPNRPRSRSTATALVDRLEETGYVERVPDPRDGRARLVRFTTKGESLPPIAGTEEQRVEREWERHLGARGCASASP